MSPSTSSQDRLLLEDVSRSAKKLFQLASGQPYQVTPAIDSPSPTVGLLVQSRLEFYDPQAVLSSLLALGISDTFSRKMVQEGYLPQAASLQQSTQQQLASTLSAFQRSNHGHESPTMYSLIVKTFSDRLVLKTRRHAELIVEKARVRIAELTQQAVSRKTYSLPDANEKRTSSFRPDAIAILEAAFAQDAYPTREDKESLAEECEMEWKQIHVWFQNRRSRSKKEGKPLQKRQSIGVNISRCSTEDLDPKLFVFKSYDSFPIVYEQSPSPGPSSQLSSSTSSTTSDALPDPFFTLAPPHAFPTPYPPTCEYEPFSESKNPSYFSVQWRRRVARSNVSKDVSDVEMDELTSSFARLAIDTPSISSQRRTTVVNPKSRRIRPTCYGFEVIPLKAPLPALQRVTVVATPSTPISPTPLPVKSRTHSATHSWTWQQPLTDLPSSKRKPRPRTLRPIRVPKSDHAVPRDDTHPYAVAHKRHSMSSRSCSSSSVSSLSSLDSSDSSIRTPPQLPVPLPLHLVDSVVKGKRGD